ncbi:MAG: Ni/Fe-hydrogenase, b-type cytochrome subunit [Planctomycetota bacterium]
MNSLQINHRREVYAWSAGIRIWHWIQVVVLIALGITGYLIASPPASLGGEASDHYRMGTIRFIHFASAYFLVIGFLFRVYLAIVGKPEAREIFLPPVWRKDFWQGVWHEVRWYSFLEKKPNDYVGHNPLAMLGMHIGFVWVTVFMMVTGLALYGEGTGMGTWQYEWFSSWVIPFFGQSQDVHTWHHLGMWMLLCFTINHIYLVVREDIMSGQTVMSSMISGWRLNRDGRTPNEPEERRQG